MRATTAIIALALALVVGGTAAAEELQLGFGTSFEYDDNVFNTPDNSTLPRESDVAFRAGPEITLQRPEGDLTYEIRYRPRWESYIRLSGLDAWDHEVRARASYRLGPQTSIAATERFLITHSQNRAIDTLSPDTTADPSIDLGEPQVEFRREETKHNTAGLTLSHSFNRRVAAALSANYLYFDATQRNFTSQSYVVTAQSTYVLDRRNTIGGGVGWTQQVFDSSTQPNRTTDFYRAFALWDHVFDPTLTLSMQLGPTWVDAGDTSSGGPVTAPIAPFVSTFAYIPQLGGFVQAAQLYSLDSCPRLDSGQPYFSAVDCQLSSIYALGALNAALRNPDNFIVLRQVDSGSGSNSSLTAFGLIRLVKTWETVTGELSYSRTDSSTTGTGVSTIVDTARGRVAWRPTDRWTLTLNLSWARRTAATDQTVTVIGLQDLSNVAPGVRTGQAAYENLRLLKLHSSDTIDTAQVRVGAERRIGRRVRIFVNGVYFWQQADRGDLGSTNLDNYRILLGFRWSFEPVRL